MDVKESIHIYRNGLCVYLHRTTTKLVFQVVDSALSFLKTLTPRYEELDLKSLPHQFVPLVPLIRLWGMIDDTERDERREVMSRTELRALVEEVRPYLPAIDAYLDSFAGELLSEPAIALGGLAEFVAESILQLKNEM